MAIRLTITNGGGVEFHLPNGVTLPPGRMFACEGDAAEMLLGVEPPGITAKALVALFAHIERVRDNWCSQTGTSVSGDHYRYERNEDTIHFHDEWGQESGGEIPLRAFYDFDGAVVEYKQEQEASRLARAEVLREHELRDLYKLAERHNFLLMPK